MNNSLIQTAGIRGNVGDQSGSYHYQCSDEDLFWRREEGRQRKLRYLFDIPLVSGESQGSKPFFGLSSDFSPVHKQYKQD